MEDLVTSLTQAPSLTEMAVLCLHAFGYLEGLSEKKNCNSVDILERERYTLGIHTSKRSSTYTSITQTESFPLLLAFVIRTKLWR